MIKNTWHSNLNYGQVYLQCIGVNTSHSRDFMLNKENCVRPALINPPDKESPTLVTYHDTFTNRFIFHFLFQQDNNTKLNVSILGNKQIIKLIQFRHDWIYLNACTNRWQRYFREFNTIKPISKEKGKYILLPKMEFSNMMLLNTTYVSGFKLNYIL